MLLPSNPLEKALFNSASDENQAPKFYELLIQSNIFLLGTVIDKGDGTFNLDDNQEFDIHHWEKEDDASPIIPFFTSLQILQQAIPDDSPYLEMPAAVFFEMTLGVSLVLNPNTDYGLELDADDVSILLNSDIDERDEDFEFDPETEMSLGKLTSFPQQLCKAITNVLSNYPEIETAYLASIYVPSEDREPHLLIGLQSAGELDEDMIKEIANSISPDDNDSDYEMFDFYTVTDDDPEGVSQFLMEENTSFYQAPSTKVH
ncbi:MAG: hypothetical protein DSZ29_00075 [Aquificaceae bacterium]|nr:MAG: hypothetical protein DSZ29_00075 [Aquificaceae bacterium]